MVRKEEVVVHHMPPEPRCSCYGRINWEFGLGKCCKVSDNAERRGFCADEIIDSY